MLKIKLFLLSLVPAILIASLVNAQGLEDGEYFIKVINTGKYLAIDGASRENGAAVVQWDFANQDNHKFIVKKNRDGVSYTIAAKHSGRYLNAEGGNEFGGTRIIQWDFADADHVKWYITKNDKGDGWYIINKKSQTRMRLRDGESRTDNGMPIVINRASPEQLFNFELTSSQAARPRDNNSVKISTEVNPASHTILANVPDGVYKIRANGSGKYLAIAGQFDTHDNVGLIQWDFLPRNNHLFRITKQADQTYSITPVHSNKPLDAAGSSLNGETPVQQQTSNDSATQHWRFYNDETGVGIANAAIPTGRLHLTGGRSVSDNGVAFVVGPYITQTFALEPATPFVHTTVITLSNMRLTPLLKGDLDFYGRVEVILYDSQHKQIQNYINGNGFLMKPILESNPIDLNKVGFWDFHDTVSVEIPSDRPLGDYLVVNYGIVENDADVASPFVSFGSSTYEWDKNFTQPGNDDNYFLKKPLDNCLRRSYQGMNPGMEYRSIFSVNDVPDNCSVRELMKDEDSEDQLELSFTISKTMR